MSTLRQSLVKVKSSVPMGDRASVVYRINKYLVVIVRECDKPYIEKEDAGIQESTEKFYMGSSGLAEHARERSLSSMDRGF